MKKKSNKRNKFLLGVILILVGLLIGITVVNYLSIGKFQKAYNERRIEDAEVENKMVKEVMKERTNVDNYIDAVVSNPEIIILQEFGRYSLTHDKTPSNDFFTEWLLNSEVEIRTSYNLHISIPTDKIVMSELTDGVIVVLFDKEDFKVGVDIHDLNSSQIKSVLGKNYTSNEIAALINIIHDNLLKERYTEENKDRAAKVLMVYLTNMASKMGVEVKFAFR